MSLGMDLFDNDERVLINHLTNGSNVTTFEKKNLLLMLDFQRGLFTEDTDEDVKALVEATYSKVNLLTDEEWNNMRNYLPFDCFDAEMEEEEIALV